MSAIHTISQNEFGRLIGTPACRTCFSVFAHRVAYPFSEEEMAALANMLRGSDFRQPF
jgi:hypothetical protein